MDDVNFLTLWLPIVLSAVTVFIASFLAWVVSPHHRHDWRKIPNEDGFLEALRASGTPPGQYMFPYCADPGELKDPDVKKRWEAGPNGTLTVWAGPPNQFRNMVLSFAFYLVVGVFVAYVAAGAAGLEKGAEYLHVFRVTGTVAVMAYCLGFIPHAIWFGKSLGSVAKDVFDGVIYALLTAGFFGWLWPAADVAIENGLPIG